MIYRKGFHLKRISTSSINGLRFGASPIGASIIDHHAFKERIHVDANALNRGNVIYTHPLRADIYSYMIIIKPSK
jgi:hypothetical protein